VAAQRIAAVLSPIFNGRNAINRIANEIIEVINSAGNLKPTDPPFMRKRMTILRKSTVTRASHTSAAPRTPKRVQAK
jgi:hypothetical protein